MKEFSEFDQAISALSGEIEFALKKISPNYKKDISEVRIRLNSPVMITYKGKNVKASTLVPDEPCLLNVDKEKIKNTVALLCNNAIYSRNEEIKQGFISLKGGHRAGICGTAVLENGKITAVKDFSSLNIRVARFIENAADEIYKELNFKGLFSFVIASSPGGGKTTLIKSLAKKLSNNGVRVALIDERFEMNETDLGINTDILSGYPKALGITTAVRTLSPEIIICDEVGEKEEIESLKEAVRLSVPVIITLHASSREDVLSNKSVINLIKTAGIKKIFFLNGPENAGKIKETVRINELFC